MFLKILAFLSLFLTPVFAHTLYKADLMLFEPFVILFLFLTILLGALLLSHFRDREKDQVKVTLLVVFFLLSILLTSLFTYYMLESYSAKRNMRGSKLIQDKVVCASSSIELVNYNTRFKCPYSISDPEISKIWLSEYHEYCTISSVGADMIANETLQIRYGGRLLNCTNVITNKTGESSCPIGLKDPQDSDKGFMIYVDKNSCSIYKYPVDLY